MFGWTARIYTNKFKRVTVNVNITFVCRKLHKAPLAQPLQHTVPFTHKDKTLTIILTSIVCENVVHKNDL